MPLQYISILGKPSGEAERTFKTMTTMAEDLKKKQQEQLKDEQLDEVTGGAPIPSCNCGQGTKTVQKIL